VDERELAGSGAAPPAEEREALPLLRAKMRPVGMRVAVVV